jgi:DNA primase
MFKLLDNPPPYLSKEDNPFSVVFETAWYALKQNKLKTDDDLMNLKFRLIRRLIEHKVETETIYALLDFINIYLPFANSKKEPIFEREIESLIDNDNDMEALTIRQLYDRKIREDGQKLYKQELRKHQKTEIKHKESEKLRQEEARMRQEEARMRQEEARMRQEEARMRQEEAQIRQEKLAITVVKLYSEGFSPERISDVLLEPLEIIQGIICSTPSV